MILPNYNKNSLFDVAVNNSFLLYKDATMTALRKSWKEEDYNEVGKEQFRASQYLLALQLVILVHLDYTRYPSAGWSFYTSKFNLETYSKCLKCYNINLDKILAEFGLPTVAEGIHQGIQAEIIEDTFEIETTTPVSASTNVSLLTLLEEGETCTIYLEDNCLYQKCN